MNRLRVAIGDKLKTCPHVITLGVRPHISDYSREERELLRGADVVFYPTIRFVELFATLEKETFPSANCYRLQGDRLKQTTLLRMLNAPHPRTRVYYGYKQKLEILKDFVFPFVAKRPFGSSEKGQVFLIDDQEKLDFYNQHFNPAYIQEYVNAERELRVIVLNYHTMSGYWRKAVLGVPERYPAHNEAQQMDNLPPDVDTLARHVARTAGLSDVSLEVLYDGSHYWIVELNFLYGEETWPQVGQNRLQMVMEMIDRGEL